MSVTAPSLEIDASRSLQEQLVRAIRSATPEMGVQASAIEGLDLCRADTTSPIEASVYEPSLCFLIQGRKTVQLGDREIVYRPLTYLVSNVHLPVVGRIVEASPERPFLGVKLVLDPKEISELVLASGSQLPELDPNTPCPEASCALCMAEMDAGMQTALSRLLSLLDSPSDIPVLAPLARREILYRALTGEMGPRIRKFITADSRVHRISHVVATLKDRYRQPLRINELADEANMSESSLYHSFKQVTRMSPLQFQKKLRLHEARKLMLIEGLEAAAASYRVGYESPSQFSREYSRLFGAPPRTDVTKLRGATASI